MNSNFNKDYLKVIFENSDILNTIIPLYDECPFCHSTNFIEDDSSYDNEEYVSENECQDCGKTWKCIYKCSGSFLSDGTKLESAPNVCPICGSENFKVDDWDNKGAVYELTNICEDCNASWTITYDYDENESSNNLN